MKFIDTHAHVNFNNFRDDADEVIRRSLTGNTDMILVGSELRTSKRALEYANKYEKGVYAAVGLHPMHLEKIKVEEEKDANFTTQAEEFNYDNYEKLAKSEKVVAIGEIGLDYSYIKISPEAENSRKKQRDVFIKQLLLARHLELPAIIHCRVAHIDLLQILKDFKEKYKDLIPKDEPWGVIHCFSGDEDLAWEYFNLGLLISFTGLITFSKQWDDLIRKMPSDKFMIETDCPFMTPEPFRGKRNEPILVKNVAERIAEIRKISLEKIAKVSTENAQNLFDI
ncbi:TatD family hydrolase [bacterium]|nr:TatD family hydrolase [bacterium]